MRIYDLTGGRQLLEQWREHRSSTAREMRHVHKARVLLRQAGASDLLLDHMEALREDVRNNLANHGFARRVTVADAVAIAREHQRNARGYADMKLAREAAGAVNGAIVVTENTNLHALDTEYHALEQWRDLNRRWARQFLQAARILKREVGHAG